MAEECGVSVVAPARLFVEAYEVRQAGSRLDAAHWNEGTILKSGPAHTREKDGVLTDPLVCTRYTGLESTAALIVMRYGG